MSLPASKKCCARPGLKRPAQVTVQQMQKKDLNMKRRKGFNAKWCEGRPWLKYDRDENVMTCTKYGKRGETGYLKNKHLFITGCNNFRDKLFELNVI